MKNWDLCLNNHQICYWQRNKTSNGSKTEKESINGHGATKGKH